MAAPTEHIITIGSADRERLLEWLAAPNGSLRLSERLVYEAVEGGGVMVRTTPWKPQEKPPAGKGNR